MKGHLDVAPGLGLDGVLKPHPKVLVVDGDPSSLRMLRSVLDSRRYKVLWSHDGADALRQAVESRPDVIVLELDLPDGDGFEVLGELREWNETPVIILTGRTSIADKVRALDAGANDYVDKPFAPEELAARLRVLLRSEPPNSDGPLLVSGALKINMATREMTINGGLLELTGTEEALLYILARHAGKLVPCGRLIRAIWGKNNEDKTANLMVHIAGLRKKFDEFSARNLIRGEAGLGYTLSIQ
jgi:two-component system KDP operon response regulator KdpE